MFRGLFEHAIDLKGRTSVPVRWRSLLGRGAATPAVAVGQEAEGQIILTEGLDRCLVGYSLEQWQAFEARLAGLSQFDPAVVQLKRLYVASASECPLDKQGRILIPPGLRDYAGLGRDVVWAGMVTTVEIWAKEAWAVQREQARASSAHVAQMRQVLTELGL